MEENLTIIFFTAVTILLFLVMMFFLRNRPVSRRQSRVFSIAVKVVLIVGVPLTCIVPFVGSPESAVVAFVHSHLRLAYLAIVFILSLLGVVVGLVVRAAGHWSTARVPLHVEGQLRHMSVAELGRFISVSLFHLSLTALACSLLLVFEVVVLG